MTFDCEGCYKRELCSLHMGLSGCALLAVPFGAVSLLVGRSSLIVRIVHMGLMKSGVMCVAKCMFY